MGYLKNISRTGGGHLGGVLTLQVRRVADVISMPLPIKGIIHGNIVMREGAQSFKWIAGYQSIGIKTASRPTREGASKESSLEFIIVNDVDDVRDMLNIAERDEFIVLFTYPNGKTKVFGTLKAPVQFRFDHDSGTDSAGKNGYSCQFYYAGPENSFFYDGDSSAPSGTPPVVVLFNGVAIASLQAGESLNIESDYSFNQYFITQ